jgi:hypothetical protein
MKEEKFDKRIFKKKGDDLQGYLQFKRRGSSRPGRKGKGSYKRKEKHPNREEE